MSLTNYDLDEDTYVPRSTLNRSYPVGKYDAWVELDRGYRIPSHNTANKLEPGVYCFRIHRDNVCIKQEKMYTDELYELPDSIAQLLCREFETFCESEDGYRQFKLSHRRGVLLYGPQGGGKTSTVHRVVHHAIERDGVAFQMDVNPELFIAGLRMFRSVEPSRIIVCFMEDLDALIEKFGEPSILSLLDGEAQIDGVYNIGTTNFPEKLEKRIINRPRRFDRVIKVKKPDENLRREYIRKKLELAPDYKEDETKLKGLLEASDGLSFSALTELIISTEIMKIPLEEAKTIIRKLEKSKPTSEEDKGKLGFD